MKSVMNKSTIDTNQPGLGTPNIVTKIGPNQFQTASILLESPIVHFLITTRFNYTTKLIERTLKKT